MFGEALADLVGLRFGAACHGGDHLDGLLLKENRAEGLGENRYQAGVQEAGAGVAVAAGDIAGDRVAAHGSGTNEGDRGDQVLEVLGLERAGERELGGDFELERADRRARPEHAVGLLVVMRDAIVLESPVALADVGLRIG